MQQNKTQRKYNKTYDTAKLKTQPSTKDNKTQSSNKNTNRKT